MKQTLIHCCAGVLIGILFAGCNELKQDRQQPPQTEEGTEISPIPVNEVDDEVAAFFDENAGLIVREVIKDTPYKNARCIMINNAEEFPEVIGKDGLPIKFPAIDFDSNTLILGVYATAHSGIIAVSQSLVVEQDTAVINLVIGTMKGEMDFEQVAGVKSLWNIYPKITSKSIRTNVTYEK